VPLNTVEKIGFIGGGNMAEAIIKGLLSGGYPSEKIIFSEPNDQRRELMQKRYGVISSSGNLELVTASNIVVLAIKPQILDQVLADIKQGFDSKTLLISILAGVTTSRLELGLGGSPRVVRAMPNTPALAGIGASALSPGLHVEKNDRLMAQQLFEAVGIALWVEEGEMDAVTGLSGSGPAYIYSVIEALTAGGVANGLTDDVALQLATQTVIGAARMVQQTGEPPAVLRDRVCSPGGTTIAAVKVLEERGLRSILIDAVTAATSRSKELGK